MANMIDNDALLLSWNRNLEYAQRLVRDVPADRMAHQPAPNTNHPAWVLSHLNAYHPVIVAVLRGERFDDPKDHPFGMQSKPVADASAYASKDELVDAFARGHADVAEALRAAPASRFAEPPTLERWRAAFPTNAGVLAYVMLVHESTHLGQLSVWRRVQGLPAV